MPILFLLKLGLISGPGHLPLYRDNMGILNSVVVSLVRTDCTLSGMSLLSKKLSKLDGISIRSFLNASLISIGPVLYFYIDVKHLVMLSDRWTQESIDSILGANFMLLGFFLFPHNLQYSRG